MPNFVSASTPVLVTNSFPLPTETIPIIEAQLEAGNELRIDTSGEYQVIQSRPASAPARLFIPSSGTSGSCLTGTFYTLGFNPTSTTTCTANTYFPADGTTWCVVTPNSTGSWVTVWSTDLNGPEHQRQLRKSAHLLRKKVLTAKGAIKRALKLFDSFGMTEDARIFLSGGLIEVSHPESLFKFVIRKSKYKGLIQNTHTPTHMIPYDLSLETKTGLHIANLCVYMEQTPVFDQVLALAMFIKTGCEEDILREANFFNKTEDPALRELVANEYPFLQDKLLLGSGSYVRPASGLIIEGSLT